LKIVDSFFGVSHKKELFPKDSVLSVTLRQTITFLFKKDASS